MLAEITAALSRGDTLAALSAAQAAVAAEPDNAQAHYLLSAALKQQGDLEGARVACDRAIQLAPDNAMYSLGRAALALSGQDLASAEQSMKQVLVLDPNQLPAYVSLIHLLLAQGRKEEAASYLKMAQRVNAEHPHVRVAEGHLAQLEGRSEDALRLFSAAVQADPGFALGQVSLGLALAKAGHTAFAEQALSNAANLDPSNAGVLRALVEACMKQEKFPEAEQALDKLIALTPEIPHFAARAEARLKQGKDHEAMEDLSKIADQAPGHLPTLNLLVLLLARSGRAAEAIARVETALTSAPSEGLWLLRLGLCGDDAALRQQVLERWLADSPESAFCLEQWALQCELMGQFEAAQGYADRALALNPLLGASALVKIRGDIQVDPQKVLDRLQELAPRASTPDAERMALAWKGVAHDRLGQYLEASTAWRDMAQRVLPLCPVPNLMIAEQVPEGVANGRAIWAPPGVRIDRVFTAVFPQLGERLLTDRTGPEARQDGFGMVRDLPGGKEAGSAGRWQEAIVARGLEPATVVDWLPHWDAYTAQALRGLQLTAVLCDPRDAFLNWLVHGSAQGYLFIPDTRISAEWLARVLEAVADHRDAHPDAVTVVSVDALDSAPAEVSQRLQAALALAEQPAPELLADTQNSRGHAISQFPAGHWRHYREAFADEFARLAVVAQRLGYPAE